MRFSTTSIRTPLVGALIAVLVPAVSVGQQNRPSSRQDERATRSGPVQPQARGGQPQRSQQQGREQRRLSGHIVRTKQVDVRGDDRKVLVAIVETTDGRRQVIDLGFTRQLGVPVRSGQGIGVTGNLDRVGDHTVLRATSLRTRDDVVRIRRMRDERAPRQVISSLRQDRQARPQAEQRTSGYPVSQQERNITGQIVGERTARLRNSDQRNKIVRIRDQAGRFHVVDLGSQERVNNVGVSEGDWITVMARPARLPDGTLLLATQFSIAGEPLLAVRRERSRRSEPIADRPRDSGQARRPAQR